MSEVDNGYWAVLELLGHVKVAGYLTEVEQFGSQLGRIDIPSPAGGVLLTQFFGGASVYRITPTTEEVARAYAAATNPEPIALYELELPAGYRYNADAEREFDLLDNELEEDMATHEQSDWLDDDDHDEDDLPF